MKYEDAVSMELLYRLQKYLKLNQLTLQEYYLKKNVSEQLVEKVLSKKELTYREIETICKSINIPLDLLRIGPMETTEFKKLVHEVSILEKKQKSILLPLYEKRYHANVKKIVPQDSISRYLLWLEYQIIRENGTTSQDLLDLMNNENCVPKARKHLFSSILHRFTHTASVLTLIRPSSEKSIEKAQRTIKESKKKK